MYNTEKMIRAGRAAIGRNPQRDITAAEIMQLKEQAADNWQLAENSFLLGVAVGMRIAEAERMKEPAAK